MRPIFSPKLIVPKKQPCLRFSVSPFPPEIHLRRHRLSACGRENSKFCRYNGARGLIFPVTSYKSRLSFLSLGSLHVPDLTSLLVYPPSSRATMTSFLSAFSREISRSDDVGKSSLVFQQGKRFRETRLFLIPALHRFVTWII